MRNNIIVVFVILIMALTVLAPLTAAQEPPLQDFNLTINNPVVFLASTMTGNVSGPNGTEYNLILVNMTSFETFQLGGGVFNSSHTDNYTVYMNSDYYPAGRYTLNLTVDGITIMFIQVTLVYNVMFVIWEKLRMISEELTTLSYGLQNMFDWREEKDKHDARVDIILFVVLLWTIVGFMLIMYFIVLRVIKVKYACSQERAKYNIRRGKGLDIDPVNFADIEHKLAPEASRPNLNPVPQILVNAGMPPALAAECLLDLTADFGLARLMEKELTWFEKRKLKKQKEAKIKAVV